jgi:hypothetical protein
MCSTVSSIFLSAFLAMPGTFFASFPVEPEILGPGAWGGRGAALRVAENRAEVEFDCAMGRIDESIEIQADGAFFASGLYFRDPGGPGRVGDPDPPGVPAKYSGFRKGSKIHLSIQLVNTGQAIGPFVLHQSQQPDLEKCL